MSNTSSIMASVPGSELARVAAQLAELRAGVPRSGLRAEALATLDQRRQAALPITPELADVLPQGLPRGSTVCVGGSVSLLLAMLGAGSASGAWCALVGGPRISAEAAAEYGIDLARVVVVPHPGRAWTSAVGALLDAVEVVVVWPPEQLAPGEVRRLMARARARNVVLVVYQGDTQVSAGASVRVSSEISGSQWPGAEVRLVARQRTWSGPIAGYGRLVKRHLVVEVTGRGQAVRARSVALWLPSTGGGVRLASREVDALDVAALDLTAVAG